MKRRIKSAKSGIGGDRAARSADQDEIPVTHEMIEAGTFQYASADDILETPEEIVSRIFRAMVRARTLVPALPHNQKELSHR